MTMDAATPMGGKVALLGVSVWRIDSWGLGPSSDCEEDYLSKLRFFMCKVGRPLFIPDWVFDSCQLQWKLISKSTIC